MKREEYYCDVCGAKISELDGDGNLVKTGIEFNTESLCATLIKKHSHGTISSLAAIFGKDFCSFACLERSVVEWMSKISKFFKEQ